MVWLYVLCVSLVLIIAALIVKIASIKRDIRSIAAEFSEKSEGDTNTLIVVSGSDKTVRKLAADINETLKNLRKQRLRFEKGDAELKNAVTNISHDLRTPLTAIDGYLTLFEQAEKSSDAERYTGIIKNRTEALKLLVDELFLYSVIISPDRGGKKEKVNINAVLEDCVVGHYAALKQRDIFPEIIMPEITVCRTLDRAALSRVCSNLIENVIKYSDGDLKIELTERGDLSFSNMASGLTEVQAERLFDRFYTVESARRSTGLGLCIAKALVEQMDGTIGASYSGGRLTINIALPTV